MDFSGSNVKGGLGYSIVHHLISRKNTTYIPLIVLAEPGRLYSPKPTFYGNQEQPLNTYTVDNADVLNSNPTVDSNSAISTGKAVACSGLDLCRLWRLHSVSVVAASVCTFDSFKASVLERTNWLEGTPMPFAWPTGPTAGCCHKKFSTEFPLQKNVVFNPETGVITYVSLGPPYTSAPFCP